MVLKYVLHNFFNTSGHFEPYLDKFLKSQAVILKQILKILKI